MYWAIALVYGTVEQFPFEPIFLSHKYIYT